jgi:hypothetical protein
MVSVAMADRVIEYEGMVAETLTFVCISWNTTIFIPSYLKLINCYYCACFRYRTQSQTECDKQKGAESDVAHLNLTLCLERP